MARIEEIPSGVTGYEMRSLLAGITGMPADEIAVWTVVIGVSGGHDVAVMPAEGEDGADVRQTLHLLAAAISYVVEAVALNPED